MTPDEVVIEDILGFKKHEETCQCIRCKAGQAQMSEEEIKKLTHPQTKRGERG